MIAFCFAQSCKCRWMSSSVPTACTTISGFICKLLSLSIYISDVIVMARAAWLRGNGRRAHQRSYSTSSSSQLSRLALKWVTVCMYITIHPGKLSLAIPSSTGYGRNHCYREEKASSAWQESYQEYWHSRLKTLATNWAGHPLNWVYLSLSQSATIKGMSSSTSNQLTVCPSRLVTVDERSFGPKL